MSTTAGPAVVFFIFKRPEQTRQVFEAIRKARPACLFVVADGARNPEEQTLCDQTRAVVEQVDWPCEVVTNYATSNMGLRERISSGISWVFDQSEEAIFLEDDCLPHPTFFRFCAELLERYRRDPRVMHISGDCFVNIASPQDSYYFTRYAHVWGWASWRRAWELYDPSLAGWADSNARKRIQAQSTSRSEVRFWNATLGAVQRGEIDTWDYQWNFSLMSANGRAINPTANLLKNIGFGGSATNTADTESSVANLPVIEMRFPLVHPEAENTDSDLDRLTAELFFTRERVLISKARAAYHGVRKRVRGLQRGIS